jgi:anaerobic magnesium-protoporphyrin IX monomethyl ester cyclase
VTGIYRGDDCSRCPIDPDQIQALYATPHSWTPFARQEAKHRVVQTDLSRWDYKHQVLESACVPNWRVLLWVKLIEVICQMRPKALWRVFMHPERRFRDGMRWYSNIGRRVWPYEIWHWIFFDRRTRVGPTLAEFLNGGWERRRPCLTLDVAKGAEKYRIRRYAQLSSLAEPAAASSLEVG